MRAVRVTRIGLFVAGIILLILPVRVSAQNVRSQFTTDKSSYLIGEPVYVVLSITNNGDMPLWIGFGLADRFCANFAIEMPGADSALEKWGCGVGSSCGRFAARMPSPNHYDVVFRKHEWQN